MHSMQCTACNAQAVSAHAMRYTSEHIRSFSVQCQWCASHADAANLPVQLLLRISAPFDIKKARNSFDFEIAERFSLRLCTAGILYTVLPGHYPVAAGKQRRCRAPLHQLCQCHRFLWLCGHPSHWLAAGPQGVRHHPGHHQLHWGHRLCATSHPLAQATGRPGPCNSL